MRHSTRLTFFIPFLIFVSCASVRLGGVDFGWPVESVQTVGQDNMINDGRYAISCNVGPLADEEFGDSTALRGNTLRLLRSTGGYYFVTGPRFRNVYVFAPGQGELSLNTTIEIYPRSEEGDAKRLAKPALNQRGSLVELIDGSLKLKLDAGGIVESTESAEAD